MFQRNICEKKYNKGEISRQIQEIVVPYFFTNASIKNKIKFGLILLKITKIYGGRKMIPKVIHYCWFGNGKIPEKIKMYRQLEKILSRLSNCSME